MKTKISAIICAAGKGERAGFDKNKLLAPLYGAPALYHTLKKFNIPEIDEVIVTSSVDDLKEIRALCAPFGYKVVTGGATRTQSVKNALEKVSGDVVLIHDGARPYVSEKLIKACITCVMTYGSGVCAVKATDTAVYGNLGVISAYLDRNALYTVQTPQGFLTEDIKSAYALAGDKNYTDDSAVFYEFIGEPRIIEGERTNVKLTFKEDFKSELPAFSAVCTGKAGFGVDVHCFGDGNFVTLGGIKINCDKGLVAHSDGDVLIHSIIDALLSAAGLKDIGHYFPDNDEKFKNADSGKLLKEVVELLNKQGYSVGNISISVQAEKPRLAPYIDLMIDNLSRIVGVDKKNVAVSAGTCEGLGFVGEGLGIAAYCLASLTKPPRA